MTKLKDMSTKDLFDGRDALVVLTRIGIEILGLEQIQAEIRRELEERANEPI